MTTLLKDLHNIMEDAAAGAISAGSVAINQGAGFQKKSKSKIKKKTIKRIFKEDKEYDNDTTMAKIKNAEQISDTNNDVIGFALEDDNDNIIKVYVKIDQSEEFENALKRELSDNQNEEHTHREIGEIIYKLKDDFDIVNIEMGAIPEDEEELNDEEESDSQLELEDDPEESDNEEKDDLSLDDEMDPEDSSEESASTALDAVISMMKSDAEARQAESEAKKKEAEAKIASLNTQAAEAQVKKSEEIMDMEAYYDDQKSADKESKQLSKLAKYRHELDNDEENANMDYVETDIPGEEEEEVKIPNSFLQSALKSLLKNKGN
jgi:hypothetical protein